MAAAAQTASKMGRNAFSTVVSASLGIVTGIVLDAMVVAIFGMGRQTDSYYVAITIPMAIITVLILQATRVVQPLLIAKRKALGDEGGWQYLNLILTTGTVIVAAFCISGVVLSPLLMRLQIATTSADEVAIAVRLSVFFFSILPLYFPIVVLRAALNSFDVFGLPGAMKFFENVFKIAFILVLGARVGVLALVFGTLAGCLFQLGAFYVVLRKKGFRFKPFFGLKHPDMVQAYGVVGFQLTGQTVSAGVDVVNNTLGSMVGEGSVTAFRLATRIIDSFAGLLPASVVYAAMPSVAASVASGDEQATKGHVRRAVYLLLLVTVPLCVWLALMNRPLIAFLYQRGGFSTSDTILVSTLLLLTIPHLLLSRMRSLFELPFFAEQNSRTPLIASVLENGIFVVSSLILVSYLRIYGLPMGRAIASTIGPLFLGYLLTRRLGNLGFRSLKSSIGRLCLASGLMAVFIFLGNWMVQAIPVQGFTANVTALALPTAIGGLALAIALFALGVLDTSILAVVPPFWGRWLTRLLVPAKDLTKP
jgi:putative peptidoglycan lipid II flippase